MSFAGNASILANSLSVPPSANAGNMRASGKLYRKGAFFAENTACARRYAGRQGLSITGACIFNTREKSIKITPKGAGAGQSSFLTAAPPPFFISFFSPYRNSTTVIFHITLLLP